MAANYILVVDDDEDMAEVLVRVLRLAGYAARHAENGARALEIVAESAPCMILLDMLMPLMDGWQFGSELRARHGYAIPIVVVTAAENARARSEAIDADAFLSKPFELHDLMQLVARYGGKQASSLFASR